jgi:hypothetical protein
VVTLDNTALHALHRKYVELANLRQEREALERQGILKLEGVEYEARRSRTRALASEFPGALRELEHLTAEQLAGRRDAVHGTLVENQSPAIWLALAHSFHTYAGLALAIRRWLSESGPDSSEQSEPAVFRKWGQYSGLSERILDLIDVPTLRRYIAPSKSGHIELAWHDAAASQGMTIPEAKATLFGGDYGQGLVDE